MSRLTEILLELPLRRGGMGLRPFAREPAFLAGMLSARVVLRARFKLPEFDVNRTPSSRTLAAAERCAFLPERPLGAALKAARSTLEEMEGAIDAGVASRPALSGQIRGVKEWEGLLVLDGYIYGHV